MWGYEGCHYLKRKWIRVTVPKKQIMGIGCKISPLPSCSSKVWFWFPVLVLTICKHSVLPVSGTYNRLTGVICSYFFLRTIELLLFLHEYILFSRTIYIIFFWTVNTEFPIITIQNDISLQSDSTKKHLDTKLLMLSDV